MPHQNKGSTSHAPAHLCTCTHVHTVHTHAHSQHTHVYMHTYRVAGIVDRHRSTEAHLHALFPLLLQEAEQRSRLYPPCTGGREEAKPPCCSPGPPPPAPTSGLRGCGVGGGDDRVPVPAWLTLTVPRPVQHGQHRMLSWWPKVRQEQTKVTVQRFCQHVAPHHQGKLLLSWPLGQTC